MAWASFFKDTTNRTRRKLNVTVRDKVGERMPASLATSDGEILVRVNGG
jgi:hypothetical protein